MTTSPRWPGTMPGHPGKPRPTRARLTVMAGEGRSSTSFLHTSTKVVDGGAKPRHDDVQLELSNEPGNAAHRRAGEELHFASARRRAHPGAVGHWAGTACRRVRRAVRAVRRWQVHADAQPVRQL